PYISKIYLSGNATVWESFEELMRHEFQIPVSRNLIYDIYGREENVPSLINNGLLSHFTKRKTEGALINLRVKELRAQQSIEELLKTFETPQNKLLFKYGFATLC